MSLLAAFKGGDNSAMACKGTKQNSLRLMEVRSGKPRWVVNGRMADTAPDSYEIRPRKDGDGFDLISDQLRYGPIWYAGPDAVRYAVAYAKYCSHSNRAIIRVFNEGGNVTETHKQ